MQKEEASAASKAKECQLIADDAQRDLAEALPALVRLPSSATSISFVPCKIQRCYCVLLAVI